MPTFVHCADGFLVNLDHVAVLRPIQAEDGRVLRYECLGAGGLPLGEVPAAEMHQALLKLASGPSGRFP